MKNNITRVDLDAIVKYLSQEDPMLTNGPKVKEFEAEYLNYLDAKHKDVLVALKAGKYSDEITNTLTKVAREISDKY